MKRTKAWSMAGLSTTAALAAAAGGASWYYASRLTEPPIDVDVPEPPPTDHVEVQAVQGDRIVLSGADAARPGRWGIAQGADASGMDADGYGQAGAVIATDGEEVTRRFRLLSGELTPGAALLDGYAWPNDGSTLDPEAHEVQYRSGVGPAPAWFIPGTSDTWVIAVHGRAAFRHEGFRLSGTIARRGMPMLMISYRNDRDAPRSPDNRSHLGHTEWEDVEAAIDHALARGARDVILVGFSMGGACVAQCVRRSDRARFVRALVLEAPVLDWGPTVRHVAINRGIPAPLLAPMLPMAMGLARWRAGINFGELRSDGAALDHPTLLIHGEEDDVVPVELSDALATARPDIVTYLRVPGAGHVGSWNVASDHVEMGLGAFLDSVAHRGVSPPSVPERLEG